MDAKDKIIKRALLASGKDKVELVLTGCKVVNVFSHKIIETSIAIDSGKIIGLGDYDAHRKIDMKGAYVAPGLIDSHVHIESSMVSPEEMAKVIVGKGTTTIIADPHEIANVCGIDGIKYMMESSKDIPLNVFFMLPSCVPATSFEHSGAVLAAKDLSELIEEKRVLGLGEIMDYPKVINGDPGMIDKMLLAQGKIIDGHGPMLSGKALNAYMINGVRTDHECTTIEEMDERLSLGMYVSIREGSAARDLLKLLPGINESNQRRCTMCTDDKHPEDIIKEGHIDHNVRLAIGSGMHPITAINMATINAAECYNLRDIGAIAPGYDADLIIFDDLEKFEIRQVYKKGVLVADSGNTLFEVHKADASKILNTVKLTEISESDLKIPLKSDIARVIRIIPGSLLTEMVIRKVSVDSEGCFESNKYIDIVKLAVIGRHDHNKSVGLGLIENFELKGGAIALSIAHDSHNIIVAGDNDRDMVIAVEKIRSTGGGIAVAKDGEILSSLELPLGGIMSDRDMEHVSLKVTEMRKDAFEKLSVSRKIDPIMTLSFLALPVIPDIKLTDMGLFDVTRFEFVKLDVED